MLSYLTLSRRPESWRVALEKGVWGVSEKARGLWAKVQPGDIVAFYAIGAIITYVLEKKKITRKSFLFNSSRSLILLSSFSAFR